MKEHMLPGFTAESTLGPGLSAYRSGPMLRSSGDRNVVTAAFPVSTCHLGCGLNFLDCLDRGLLGPGTCQMLHTTCTTVCTHVN
jgi:hypothetical protein